MSQDFADEKSTSVQVMAWCHQAPSHYLSLCWYIFMTPYCVTRPQWLAHPCMDQDSGNTKHENFKSIFLTEILRIFIFSFTANKRASTEILAWCQICNDDSIPKCLYANLNQ